GGRPHAEAMALAQAGVGARGATAYVTLEPCAHVSARGPACAALLVEAGVARVVVALGDPDPRTNGAGIALLRYAGITVEVGPGATGAARAMAGFLTRRARARPHVTLKLATSLDGCIALADGTSRWITGAESRAHAHLERARADAILVGRGTYDADAPRLDVRLAGLEDRTPHRVLLTGGAVPDGWAAISSPDAAAGLAGVDWLLVEGGAQTAAAFLRADLVDRLLLYRAPIVIGGRQSVGDIGLADLGPAHGRWRRIDTRRLGTDTLEVYERA
ncbi:bifunctional diaminohydroxyphosphoribosylaminopyrimidine deaminase/5-amino-6-(5-phosphoribosylamino)uracil reductase RibD, partial [Sphingomonas sp.]|uniref:bifunctional diaminohydroxyphosphoribosylaminopyrimidine deaminase/5-amino-6-(5-phosphoribosylamino)uracil reductase RibD n=1 Tax=Sphingomonas sp. TaxID=28214 RepID=UPI002B983CEA